MGERPTWELALCPLLLLVVVSLVLNNCGAPQTYDPQGSNTCSLKVTQSTYDVGHLSLNLQELSWSEQSCVKLKQPPRQKVKYHESLVIAIHMQLLQQY